MFIFKKKEEKKEQTEVKDTAITEQKTTETPCEPKKGELGKSVDNLATAFLDVGKNILKSKPVSNISKTFDKIDDFADKQVQKIKKGLNNSDDK